MSAKEVKITVPQVNRAIKEKMILPDEISDGYHTISELYSHRITIFIALCKELANNPEYQSGQKSKIWKSIRHSDGTLYDGWFILGIGIEDGEQITYHLPMTYWTKTKFAGILEKAPKFDGHTPKDVLKRLLEL